MVSLKYFFDLEPYLLYQLLYKCVFLSLLFKFSLYRMGETLYDGLITVKEDALNLRSELKIVKERWDNSGIRETIENRLQIIRTNLPQDILNWRMK
jgi:hypothetical protein